MNRVSPPSLWPLKAGRSVTPKLGAFGSPVPSFIATDKQLANFALSGYVLNLGVIAA